jgi:hypothetical protein
MEMQRREYTLQLSREKHEEGTLEIMRNVVNVNSKLVCK